ncbi:PAC2 family protein [Ilumatobacter sp.]|uniref:PAC2 family protein n=1 Tax=Ilumatobacter sp. TaxID=1967498 RepID=UPI003AF6BEC1
MNVADVLELEIDDLGPLRSPVMLVALTGLFDISGAATTALDRFAPADTAITIGAIDPDPFYDFTQERPQVEIDEGELRVIRWPENEFDVVRGAGGRDLVVLVGVEPHLAWHTYSACITHVARRLRCEAVVTVGSAAEAVPHTRTPQVTGSTTDADLARRLGIGQPSYQGVTGVVGVIQTDLADAGIPPVSLRVGIPHYLMNAEHPQAVAALQTHLAHVLNVDAPEQDDDFADEVRKWRSLHDEVAEGDVQLQMYVKMLEHDFDQRAEAAIPSADDLGAQFEDFLKDQRDED